METSVEYISGDSILTCPYCVADLRDGKPRNFRQWCRTIGVEVPEFDGVLLWECPDCGNRWPRWGPPGSPLFELALRYCSRG